MTTFPPTMLPDDEIPNPIHPLLVFSSVKVVTFEVGSNCTDNKFVPRFDKVLTPVDGVFVETTEEADGDNEPTAIVWVGAADGLEIVPLIGEVVGLKVVGEIVGDNDIGPVDGDNVDGFDVGIWVGAFVVGADVGDPVWGAFVGVFGFKGLDVGKEVGIVGVVVGDVDVGMAVVGDLVGEIEGFLVGEIDGDDDLVGFIVGEVVGLQLIRGAEVGLNDNVILDAAFITL